MPTDEDVRDLLLDDEHPGPKDLESAMETTALSEVVTQPPLIVQASATVGETVALMQGKRQACVLIEKNGALAGIFTERDVLMKVVGHSIDLARTPITECMTADPMTLPADANVAFALSKMVLEGFRHIPLMDGDGVPTAVVSMRNLLEYLGEIHSREITTIPPHPTQAHSRSREGA
jgi:CBS domain-containing protein